VAYPAAKGCERVYFSHPGSFVIGFASKSDRILLKTLPIFRVDTQEGPEYVPRMDRQTFPATYKFGWNRVLPSDVIMRTTGDEKG